MNSVWILGNLARDPVVRATKTGRNVASFTVAVNRNFTTPQGEVKELTDWVQVTAWGALAEAVGNQLHKGNRVMVEGRYSTRSYDAKDGTKRYVTEVVAALIARPLDTRVDAEQRGDFSQFGQPRPLQDNAPFPAGHDEDIPF
ncbi:single-stranded DNA-binding protein [uncultured Dialister sp.]|jgi:single-strand DNA-binding protein|uniref:single-stranded DNA-binding protein n=1 Tax=uncultured Dialister sp. TaxID=278064 RepID=UPI00207124E3|nr:single-stranded DNA-binding protein [uncultured Dialister sp.]DAV65454.1 MAG TPA: Single strand binding protein [Caudoviricetes sp.]